MGCLFEAIKRQNWAMHSIVNIVVKAIWSENGGD